jgi:hypothetical protein
MKKKMSVEEYFRAMGWEVITLEAGNRVVCDSCNEEYTNSDEIGDVLFNRSAYCPKCANSITASAKKYNEEKYLQYPLERETFRDFVYRIR